MADKFGNKTGGRKKGTPNKNSAFVRHQLEKRGFNLLNELLDLYDQGKQQYDSMLTKILKNQAIEAPIFTGMLEEEIEYFQALSKEQKDILLKMLPFLYPKLKALEVDQGPGRKISFHLNTGSNFSVPISADGEVTEQDLEQPTIH